MTHVLASLATRDEFFAEESEEVMVRRVLSEDNVGRRLLSLGGSTGELPAVSTYRKACRIEG